MSLLIDTDLALLLPLDRHEQARVLLVGQVGPLAVSPFEPAVADLAYLIYVAYRSARVPGNMLAGRPGYEASETLLNRVLSVAARVGSLSEFGHELFESLRLSLARMGIRDARWWLRARQVHASRWPGLSQGMALTEACTAARLLDEMLYECAKAEETVDAIDPQ